MKTKNKPLPFNKLSDRESYKKSLLLLYKFVSEYGSPELVHAVTTLERTLKATEEAYEVCHSKMRDLETLN